MKHLSLFLLFVAFACGAQVYDTNNPTVSTFAGSAFSGYFDGQGQQTMFSGPDLIVSDSNSNLYVWDSGNRIIRIIDAAANVSSGVSLAGSVAEFGINPQGVYYYAASGSLNYGFYGLQSSEFAFGVCLDSRQNLYVADGINNKIYKFDTNGTQSVFVGSGNYGHIDGNGIFDSFSGPQTMTCDSADNIYVWDSGSYLIRKVDQNKNVSTVAGIFNNPGNIDGHGTNAGFYLVGQMVVDQGGNLITACGTCVRKISPSGNVTTIAGDLSRSGYVDGEGAAARFNGASGVCVVGNSIFVADSGNQRIRQITFNAQPQIVPPSNLSLSTYPGIKLTGTVGRTYQIQSEADDSGWTNETTLVLASSPFLWIDQNAVGGSKMYRAVMLP